MSWFSSTFSSSIGRKFAMALSALFLVFFLLMHLTTNMLSVFSANAFNEASHFMGTNPVVQFLLQPVLIAAVVFHFVMGFILEAKNKAARPVKYAKKDTGNATWISQNMIYSGLVILAFLVLHFIDFWVPEMNYKYIEQLPAVTDRYYGELVHKFQNPVRVVAYVIAFVLLSLHLLHGFQSSLQSSGINNKFTPGIKKFTEIYAIAIPLGFVLIAIYHFINH
ncbi:succinate dehydrogenase cytochrome b subunit [Marinoscillum sp. MHG1-6]|uniref:succinate dehydrogenase cytochrome b subunit n=1 Tax=Marinoscillum sp. MHG1-6 TaxID=2959627 RepID=UPI002157F4A9|nr:succinate dehydrogenase cytochrome b subunit [Marinoscillum sp. MHG1-6]